MENRQLAARCKSLTRVCLISRWNLGFFSAIFALSLPGLIAAFLDLVHGCERPASLLKRDKFHLHFF